MNQDEALQKWLEGRPLGTQGPDYPRDHIECVAKDAWHAAVKHTLACITTALKQQAEVADEWQAKFMRELADMIAMEKP
ncbi:MAG: hypothetical protein IID41_02665 [Planctomycetes bacterium]|nr:hypothetical protein [Planctomycetota bacterium]